MISRDIIIQDLGRIKTGYRKDILVRHNKKYESQLVLIFHSSFKVRFTEPDKSIVLSSDSYYGKFFLSANGMPCFKIFSSMPDGSKYRFDIRHWFGEMENLSQTTEKIVHERVTRSPMDSHNIEFGYHWRVVEL